MSVCYQNVHQKIYITIIFQSIICDLKGQKIELKQIKRYVKSINVMLC